jgi:hypothetical protein
MPALRWRFCSSGSLRHFAESCVFVLPRFRVSDRALGQRLAAPSQDPSLRRAEQQAAIEPDQHTPHLYMAGPQFLSYSAYRVMLFGLRNRLFRLPRAYNGPPPQAAQNPALQIR